MEATIPLVTFRRKPVSKRTTARDQKTKAYQQWLVARRDREVTGLMDAFGFLSLFKNLPHTVRNTVRDSQRFEVEVTAGRSLDGDPRSSELLDSVRTAVLTGQVTDPDASFIPLKNLFAFLGCGMDTCRALGTDPLDVPKPEFRHHSGSAGEFTAAFARFHREQFPQHLGDLWIPQIFWPLSTKSWPGERLYWPSQTFGPGPKSTFTIERSEPTSVDADDQG